MSRIWVRLRSFGAQRASSPIHRRLGGFVLACRLFGRSLLALVLLAAALAQPGPIASVYGVDYQPPNDPCGPNDPTKTSAMAVEYVRMLPGDPNPQYVQPGGLTRFAITATWRPPGPPPFELQETAFAEVRYNGSAWELSNVQLTSGIVNIAVCEGYECSGASGTHSWSFKLLVDVMDPHAGSGNLVHVGYSTTQVPAGHVIQFSGQEYVQCDSLGPSVSPSSQEFSGWDNPEKWISARCPFLCSVVGGAMSITYQ